jgi:hypothetical protein
MFRLFTTPAFALRPHSTPSPPIDGINSYPSFSPSNPANQALDEPNTLTTNPSRFELNLWRLETRRQVFSPVLLSPDRRSLTFSEVNYYPKYRQTVSMLYTHPLPSQPSLADTHSLPEAYYQQLAQQLKDDKKANRTKFLDKLTFWKKEVEPPPRKNPLYDPDVIIPNEHIVYQVGTGQGVERGGRALENFKFETLTPIDWSADGQKLLFKHQVGKLYNGLRVTKILVLDPNNQNTPIDMYPQVYQAVLYYWTKEGMTPPLNTFDWHVTPLGWQPGSNTNIETKAWAYTEKNKIFLGHWRINTATGQPQLVNLMDTPVPVAANGSLVIQ